MNTLTDDIRKGAEVNKKQKVRRTTAQLPIYRDASNLLFIVIRVMTKAPGKMTKVLDETVACGTELCRSLAFANELRGAARAEAIGIAIANAYAMNTLVGSLAFLGIISKEVHKDLKKKLKAIIAQAVGWRESATQQGRPASPADTEGGAR